MIAPAQVLGRQPELMYITPSNPNPWYGTIRDGEPFTQEQVYQLRTMGLSPSTVERITVKRNATDRELYWGIGQVPPQFHMECPIVGRRRNGKVTVICPAGWTVDVNPDGWSGAPGKPKRGFL